MWITIEKKTVCNLLEYYHNPLRATNSSNEISKASAIFIKVKKVGLVFPRSMRSMACRSKKHLRASSAPDKPFSARTLAM